MVHSPHVLHMTDHQIFPPYMLISFSPSNFPMVISPKFWFHVPFMIYAQSITVLDACKFACHHAPLTYLCIILVSLFPCSLLIWKILSLVSISANLSHLHITPQFLYRGSYCSGCIRYSICHSANGSLVLCSNFLKEMSFDSHYCMVITLDACTHFCTTKLVIQLT